MERLVRVSDPFYLRSGKDFCGYPICLSKRNNLFRYHIHWHNITYCYTEVEAELRRLSQRKSYRRWSGLFRIIYSGRCHRYHYQECLRTTKKMLLLLWLNIHHQIEQLRGRSNNYNLTPRGKKRGGGAVLHLCNITLLHFCRGKIQLNLKAIQAKERQLLSAITNITFFIVIEALLTLAIFMGLKSVYASLFKST